MLGSCSKGHSTCFHVMNSPTCLASSRNFCQGHRDTEWELTPQCLEVTCESGPASLIPPKKAHLWEGQGEAFLLGMLSVSYVSSFLLRNVGRDYLGLIISRQCIQLDLNITLFSFYLCL